VINQSINLGKLKKVYGVSPAYLQRTMFLIALSFVFFLAMMIGFYLRQNIGYFLLATAFLLVKLLMIFGWLSFRKTALIVYENGISFKNKSLSWFEIDSVSMKTQNKLFGAEKNTCHIHQKNGEEIVITDSIADISGIFEHLSNRLSKAKEI
jgi:hypothetical protein